MPENDSPIFDFAPLKEFLEKKGYTIGTRSVYEPFKPEDVKAADVTNGTISFTLGGIFVKGADGVDRQVFLYKKEYKMKTYGKPRFHICRCTTIDDFERNGLFAQYYVRANTEPVPVIDLDDGRKIKQVSRLPLCSNCRKIIANWGNTSTTFVQMLQNTGAEQNINAELDLFGYTKDWDAISTVYKEKHHYTCEECGLKIDDSYYRQYIHVHHINGDKINNRESNLKCLCLYCHANVDNHHRKRLTTGANKVYYDDFVKKYK